MAIATRYRCSSCSFHIVAWSDGNPYYLDEGGQKSYAYHPDKKHDLCIGNDVPNICLNCAEEVNVDSRIPTRTCPECAERALVELTELGGTQCPQCKTGTFVGDIDHQHIS